MMAIRCQLVHAIRGRVRLRIETPEVLDHARSLEAFLRDQPGIRDARLNRHCRSLVVSFDPVRLGADGIASLLESVSLDLLRQRRSPKAPASTDRRPAGTWFARALDQAATSLGLREPVIEVSVASGPRAVAPLFGEGPRPSTNGNGRPNNEIGPIKPERERSEDVWHTLSCEEVARYWDVPLERGLSDEEAARRLRRFGPNVLGRIASRSRWKILLEQFESLPVALLLGSAVLGVATGGLADAAVILAVVFMNAGIGYTTETHAEETILSLQGTAPSQTEVMRDALRRKLPMEQVVPGDLLVLSLGAFVPADARLLTAERLTVDESTLTGESMPVSKSLDRLSRDVPLRSRRNMVYRGTVVTGGSGLAVAVATGRETEVGKIERLMGQTRPPETPLQRELGEIGRQLVYACGAVCAAVFVAGLLRRNRPLEMLKMTLSLAVSAVPEGLPTVAATTLALGVKRMRERNVLIRRLDAVETLGSIQVFCLDKTGTITLNQMTAARVFVGMERFEVTERGLVRSGERINALANEDLRRLLEAVVLCNETVVSQPLANGRRALKGSPTEMALVRMALDSGLDVSSVRDRFPISRTEYRTESRRFMITYHIKNDYGYRWVVKGRPSDVLSLCRWFRKDGERRTLTDADRALIELENDRMASEALRVLGVADCDGECGGSPSDRNLEWLGLVGIADPIRPGMKDLIAVFHRAGIRTIMITGDQSATAYAIGKALRLGGGERLDMLDSTRLEQLDPDVLRSLAQQVHVFSAVSPSHKLQIVQALQQAGFVVAMTGDGVNDGPALRAADLGVAMGGRGAEVARLVADIVLEDDNLQTMIAAIRQGRTIYGNIRNAILYLLSTNTSELIVTFVGVAAGVGQPLNAMQLLWINLISDIFPVLALAVQPSEADVLDRPPRDSRAPFFSRQDLERVGLQATILSAGTLASHGWGRFRHGTGPEASTMAFFSLTTAQLFHLLGARSERHGLFDSDRSPTNAYVPFAMVGGMALQLLTIAVPGLRRLLGIAPIDLLDVAVCLGGAAGPFFLNELIKMAECKQILEVPRIALDANLPDQPIGSVEAGML